MRKPRVGDVYYDPARKEYFRVYEIDLEDFSPTGFYFYHFKSLANEQKFGSYGFLQNQCEYVPHYDAPLYQTLRGCND